MESLIVQRRWAAFAIATALVAAGLIAILRVANVDLNSLTDIISGIIPRSPSGTGRDPELLNGQAASTTGSNPIDLSIEDGPKIPGTDFRGAYVSGVEYLSNGSSMLEIIVPAGVEGDYTAVVAASESLEFQCVILHHYTDRLYCIGERLQEGTQVNVRIFRIDEGRGSQDMVFEANYTIGEFVPPPQSTPAAFVPYGGGFIWPDRFDDIERQREQESARFLWPLSTISSAAALWLLVRVRRNIGQTKRLIERGAPHPVA